MKKLYFFILSVLLFAPTSLFAKGDGKLSFYNYHSGESLEVAYRSGDKYKDKELEKINEFFRSRSDGKVTPIDINLIELLDDIQDHFGANTIELISGYRSKELNRRLKKEGNNVAEESMHIEGKAADIHIDEVTEEAIAEYARSLKRGGVGFYPVFDFVHIDVGDVRNWNLPDKVGRGYVAFKGSPIWQVVTDRNIYLPNEEIEFQVINVANIKKEFRSEIVAQRFDRGKWLEVATIKACEGKELGSLKPDIFKGFGKFRLVIRYNPKFPHLDSLSNEFYLKNS